MRLTESQRQTILAAVHAAVGADARVYLFGSRVDDSKRGGDIDLLIETDRLLTQRLPVLHAIETSLFRTFGDRKIDVLLKDARTPSAPIFHIAKRDGVLL
jgi:predicted nucleotidyltransferase